MARNHIACAATVLALAAAMNLLSEQAAQAASAICSEISTRLASLNSTPATRPEAYGHAIEVQRNELHRADEEMRRLGCGFSVSGSAIERCASLARQSDEMEANLAELRREVDRRSPERSRLLRLSAANGCDGAMSEPGGVRILRPGDADDLALTGTAVGDPNHIVLAPQRAGVNPNGSYRTMCVRTCDGYYFPISYAVTPAHFAADRAACERRCPGTDVQLYFHRVPEEDIERMVSVSDGTPYTALPHAFLYREFGRKPAGGCTCQETAGSFSGSGETSARGFHVLSPSGEGAMPTVDGSIVTIHAPTEPAALPAATAPAKSRSPETIEAGQQANAKSDEEAARDKSGPAGRGPVRVVGPKFFPDSSEAEVLRVPGPTPDR